MTRVTRIIVLRLSWKVKFTRLENAAPTKCYMSIYLLFKLRVEVFRCRLSEVSTFHINNHASRPATDNINYVTRPPSEA